MQQEKTKKCLYGMDKKIKTKTKNKKLNLAKLEQEMEDSFTNGILRALKKIPKTSNDR